MTRVAAAFDQSCGAPHLGEFKDRPSSLSMDTVPPLFGALAFQRRDDAFGHGGFTFIAG